MKAIDALKISRAAIRTSNGAIAVLTKRNSIGEPTVMIGWRDDGSWSTDWLLKKLAGGDWEPLVDWSIAGDAIEELEEENAKLTAEKAEIAAELQYICKVVERLKDGSGFVGEQVAWDDIPLDTFCWCQFPGYKWRFLRYKASRDQKMQAAYWKYTGPTTAPIPEEGTAEEPTTPEPPVAPDVLDKQDGRKDFFDRYYVHVYYCGNCDARNTRYVRKGVKVTSVPVTCEKCGCEIQARRQTLLLRLPEVDELAKFYGCLREEKGANHD